MTEKTKRTALIAAGVLLCAVLAVGIAGRFAARPATDDPTISDDVQETKEPIVKVNEPEVKIEGNTDETPAEKADPGKDAVSSGTEQTIQGTPTKPDAPEKPEVPGQVQKDHTAEDVPEADRNKETPPTYQPDQTEVKPQPTEPTGGSTNEAGQVYIPGFGYVDYEGDNVGIKDDSMYENGNKIGIMGG